MCCYVPLRRLHTARPLCRSGQYDQEADRGKSSRVFMRPSSDRHLKAKRRWVLRFRWEKCPSPFCESVSQQQSGWQSNLPVDGFQRCLECSRQICWLQSQPPVLLLSVSQAFFIMLERMKGMAVQGGSNVCVLSQGLSDVVVPPSRIWNPSRGRPPTSHLPGENGVGRGP